MNSPQGWYPDPLGRYDHRWFNGTSWTADVSSNGARHVDPRGSDAPTGRGRRKWPWIALVILLVLLVPAITLGQAVQRFVSPGANEVTISRCAATGSNINLAIDITNLERNVESFSIFVEILGEPFQQVVRSTTLIATDVRAGRTSQATEQIPSTQQQVECVIVAVGGELPFGIDLGPIEPVRLKAP